MVFYHSLVNIIGLHTRIRASNQMNHLLEISAQDIERISKDILKLHPILVKDVTTLHENIQNKEYNVFILPIVSSLVHKRDQLCFPYYTIHPPSRLLCRTIFFHISPIGSEHKQTIFDIQNNNLLDGTQIANFPEYPIAGTELQKENLLRKYLL